MKNIINSITLEGPDCSGKTTLYNQIHKATNYRWNIQDRSSLSMIIHAKKYNRDTFDHIENFKNEMYNLNNIMIILLPPWQTILSRFNQRGDEIQNLASLRELYCKFEEAINEFQYLPNIIVVKEEVNDNLLYSIIKQLLDYENRSFTNISNDCVRFCLAQKDYEAVGLNFCLYDDGSFCDIIEEDLNYKKEKDYYSEIRKKIISKIRNEIEGNNEYNRKETTRSRRFIYTSDTCISLAHFLIRDNMLDCKYFLRSSDVKNILHYDLNFIKSLCRSVYEEFKLENHKVKIQVYINSAHI